MLAIRCGALRLAAAVLVLLAATAGCAGPHADRTAEETLRLAASGLEGVDRYSFRVRNGIGYGDEEVREVEAFEGEVAGHTKLIVRDAKRMEPVLQASAAEAADWSPAARLTAIERLADSVEYADSTAAGIDMLRIRLGGAASADDAKRRYRQAFEKAAAQAERRTGDAGSREGQAYREAVTREIEASRAELERMLDSLAASTEVLLAVDRKRLLPAHMEETTVMRYRIAGEERTERRVSAIWFERADGQAGQASAPEGKSW